MLQPDLYLEVVDLFAVGAVDSAWQQVPNSDGTNKTLLYIKHLDGRREIVGSLAPVGVPVSDDPIIDISVLNENDLRNDYFRFDLSSFAGAAYESSPCIYDRDTNKIVFGTGTLTATREYFMSGNLYAVDLVSISKNLRDK